MAISKELANKIDELYGLGLSIRSIAEEVGLSKSYIGNYLNGLVDVETVHKVSTKCPQAMDKLSQIDINELKSEILSDILPKIKEEIRVLLEQNTDNLSVDVTKKDLIDFKNEVFNGFSGLKKEIMKEINKNRGKNETI